jgi:hypothetical protein
LFANTSRPLDYALADLWDARWRRWLLRPLVQTDASLMLRQADQVIAAADAADDLPTLLSLAPEHKELSVLRAESPYLHMWAVTCWPRYEREAATHFKSLGDRRLAATALALRAYAVAHGGAFPARLDALVPEWLPVTPRDPMARDQLLAYRPGGADPVLYSVGPDGIDDGGCDQFPPGHSIPEKVDWSYNWWKRDAVVHLRGAPVASDASRSR